MKYLSFLLAIKSFLLLDITVNAQTPTTLTSQTTKIGGLSEEVFYLGFQAGDTVQLDLEEKRGKGLKEVEIVEYPDHTVFSAYEAEKIEGEQIVVPKTGVYKFRFYNSALGKRIGKIKVSRLPVNENVSFNSTVYWKSIYDTTFTTVQEKFLNSRDTAIVNVTDQVVKVNSITNQNGNKTSFNFTLPPNTTSWSYYVGVGQEGQKAFEAASKELAQKGSSLFTDMTGYGPLVALIFESNSFIAQLQRGEDVKFYIVVGENKNLFLQGEPFYYKKKGKVINDFSTMPVPLIKHLHFCFENDNAITGIQVSVKVTAITVKENWEMRDVEKIDVSTREVPYLRE